MNYLISIIVPVYNVEKSLSRCVDSILNQTYSNFEVILVNDGSLDSSKIICEDYKKRDERVIVFNQKNSGVSAARNKGIELAKGDFICFVDSDDWIEKEYLATFFKYKVDYNNTIVLQDILRVTLDAKIVNCNFEEILITKNKFDLLLCKYHVLRFGFPFSKLYNASIIKEHNLKFNPIIFYGEDLLFLLTYLEYIDNVQLSNSALYNYADIGESLSNAYHSHESDYECYVEVKKQRDILSSKFNLNSESLEYFNKSIGHFLTRSINALYRPKHKRNKTIRLNLLKKLYSKENLEFLFAWNNNRVQRIGLFLLKNKLFGLYDSYLNTIFKVRYALNPYWTKYKKHLIKYI